MLKTKTKKRNNATDPEIAELEAMEAEEREAAKRHAEEVGARNGGFFPWSVIPSPDYEAAQRAYYASLGGGGASSPAWDGEASQRPQGHGKRIESGGTARVERGPGRPDGAQRGVGQETIDGFIEAQDEAKRAFVAGLVRKLYGRGGGLSPQNL